MTSPYQFRKRFQSYIAEYRTLAYKLQSMFDRALVFQLALSCLDTKLLRIVLGEIKVRSSLNNVKFWNTQSNCFL